MSIEEGLGILEATTDMLLKRFANLGSWGTAGPIDHPQVDSTQRPSDRFVAGWWVDAKQLPAHSARQGGPIQPIATGVHTTDMHPDDWTALITAWQTKPGDGACAHFLIGRDAAHGVVQLVPIGRNGNHLGGPGHGVFVIPGRGEVHPNIVTNGVEVHCAGGVQRIGNVWRFVEDKVAHGAAIPDDDVIPDPNRPGRGWHKITPYQLDMLGKLLGDLDAVQHPIPDGTTTKAFGEEVPSWAHFRTPDMPPRVVGHVEMDPVHRSDPWPNGMSFLRGWVQTRYDAHSRR